MLLILMQETPISDGMCPGHQRNLSAPIASGKRARFPSSRTPPHS